MTLTGLCDLMTEFMSNDLDNFKGEAPTLPQKKEQINRAYRLLSKRCALYNPKIALTLAENVYRYPKRHTATYGSYFGGVQPVQIYNVTISENPLYNYKRDSFGMWTMDELFLEIPKWQTASADTPSIAIDMGTHLVLHAKANAAAAALSTHFVSGTYIPAKMEEDRAEPDLPEEVHEALAYAAAEYAAKPIATEPEMWNRLKEFRSEWFDLIEDVRSENLMAIHATGSQYSERFSDYVYC